MWPIHTAYIVLERVGHNRRTLDQGIQNDMCLHVSYKRLNITLHIKWPVFTQVFMCARMHARLQGDPFIRFRRHVSSQAQRTRCQQTEGRQRRCVLPPARICRTLCVRSTPACAWRHTCWTSGAKPPPAPPASAGETRAPWPADRRPVGIELSAHVSIFMCVHERA